MKMNFFDYVVSVRKQAKDKRNNEPTAVVWYNYSITPMDREIAFKKGFYTYIDISGDIRMNCQVSPDGLIEYGIFNSILINTNSLRTGKSINQQK